jgi:hypothetical protein
VFLSIVLGHKRALLKQELSLVRVNSTGSLVAFNARICAKSQARLVIESDQIQLPSMARV